jgi:hypothetical protein
MLKQVSAGHSENDLVPTIKYFDKNNQRFKNKDINSYTDLKDLEKFVKEIEGKRTKTDVKRAAKTNAIKLYEDDDVLLIRPDNKDAIVCYGSGTKWCITMKDASYYENYIDANVVFYFLIQNKKRPDDRFSKIAFAVQRDLNNNILETDFFDAEDNSLKREIVNSKWSNFVDLAEKDAITRPKSFGARLKSGEKLSNEELLDYWKMNVASERMDWPGAIDKLGRLSLIQQRIIASIDDDVQAMQVEGLVVAGGIFHSTTGKLENVSFWPAVFVNLDGDDTKRYSSTSWMSSKKFVAMTGGEGSFEVVRTAKFFEGAQPFMIKFLERFDDKVNGELDVYVDETGVKYIPIFF